MTTLTAPILETVEFDQDGFMVDPNTWTPEIAEAIGQSINIELTDRHWIVINFARNEFETVTEDKELSGLLDRPIADLELSVRARNCLDSANITTIGELVGLGESEVMNLKNLGKTSMTEIKAKLAELGLDLGMDA